MGLPIDSEEQPLVEAWCKKYGKTLKPDLFFKVDYTD
jgi:hypothetical protein